MKINDARKASPIGRVQHTNWGNAGWAEFDEKLCIWKNQRGETVHADNTESWRPLSKPATLPPKLDQIIKDGGFDCRTEKVRQLVEALCEILKVPGYQPSVPVNIKPKKKKRKPAAQPNTVAKK